MQASVEVSRVQAHVQAMEEVIPRIRDTSSEGDWNKRTKSTGSSREPHSDFRLQLPGSAPHLPQDQSSTPFSSCALNRMGQVYETYNVKVSRVKHIGRLEEQVGKANLQQLAERGSPVAQGAVRCGPILLLGLCGTHQPPPPQLLLK
ncbi:hypothetical protein HAX54_000247 [Datura stramonium]|uniref:Uncharacterized protein n=1 Tax=Datura stramonium TaxID=4076 RepID=A0ABS8T0R7_DATST|nr:hypothetical protein [Datura stramonium]